MIDRHRIATELLTAAVAAGEYADDGVRLGVVGEPRYTEATVAFGDEPAGTVFLNAVIHEGGQAVIAAQVDESAFRFLIVNLADSEPDSTGTVYKVTVLPARRPLEIVIPESATIAEVLDLIDRTIKLGDALLDEM